MSEASIESDIGRPSNESEISIQDEVVDGKNKRLVKCQFCSSKILNPNSGIYIESEFELPMMAKKKTSPESEGDGRDGTRYENLKHFWQINDMYTFENICFSKTVGEVKYLACADCEIGPVGYHNMNCKISYIAIARVCHE